MKKLLENKFGLKSLLESIPMGEARFSHRHRHDTNGVEGAARVADRHLALMARTGLRAAEMAWALDVSIDEIEVQLKTLSLRLGGKCSAARFVSDDDNETPAVRCKGKSSLRHDPDHPARPLLLDRALGALGGRIILVRGKIYLDGILANFRDLVIAAAAQGVEIHYPGLRPLPAAFHTGPSKSEGCRRKNSPPSLMSVHVPY